MIHTIKKEVDPLDDLAGQAENEQREAGQGTDPATQDMEAQAAQSMAKLEAGMTKVMFALLKAGRAWAVKRLPELREEWPDDMLKEPAEAAIPLIKKYLSAVMAIVGKSEETTLFFVALIPLAYGYVEAVERHEVNVKRSNSLNVVKTVE